MTSAYTPVPGENSEENGLETGEKISALLKDASPCPWCGGQPIVDAETCQSVGISCMVRTTWVVRCQSCAGSGPWSKYSASSAIARWNRRIPVETQRDVTAQREVLHALEAETGETHYVGDGGGVCDDFGNGWVAGWEEGRDYAISKLTEQLDEHHATKERDDA